MRFKKGDVVKQIHLFANPDAINHWIVRTVDKKTKTYQVYWIEKDSEIADWFSLEDDLTSSFGYKFEKVEGWYK